MAMVRQPKNIQWWWSPQKPLEICNGLFKTIEIYNYCKNKCWETFSLLYCVIFTLWNDVRSQYIWSISNGFYGSWFTWYAKNLCFVVNLFLKHFLGSMGHPNHCWPLPSKFWKPSKNHWFQWLGPQKTFNGDGPTLSKPSKNHWSQWWPEKKH